MRTESQVWWPVVDEESRAQWTQSLGGVAGGSVQLKAQGWGRPEDYMIARSKPEHERETER